MARSKMPAQVREDVTRLRKMLPPGRPVRVRAGLPGPLCVAECRFERRRFDIVIDAKEMTCERMWRETLCHEWAHTLVWHVPGSKDHDAMWGAAYARCYCVVFRTK